MVSWFGWLFGRLVECLVNWLVWLVVWSVGRLVGWLADLCGLSVSLLRVIPDFGCTDLLLFPQTGDGDFLVGDGRLAVTVGEPQVVHLGVQAKRLSSQVSYFFFCLCLE